jgi:hydroxymethylpyrimidine/phosphomethylpyrimidine kinase
MMGVLADLAVFNEFGFDGLSVITARTRQRGNSPRVLPTDSATFAAQLQATRDLDFVKVGMLPTRAIVGELVQWLRCRPPMTVVLDPIRYSSTGLELADEASFSALRAELLPLVRVVTPNRAEAAGLAGSELPRRWEDCVDVARTIQRLMAAESAVVVTGMEGADSVTDLLFTADGMETLSTRRILRSRRGTGCRHSSVLLCGLAQGLSLRQALERAQGKVGGYLVSTLQSPA